MLLPFKSAITRTIATQFINGQYACPKTFDFRGITFALLKAYELSERVAVFNFYGLDTSTGDGLLLSISVAYNTGSDLYDAKAQLYCADTFGDDPELVWTADGMYADQFYDYPEFIKYDDPKRKPEPKADPEQAAAVARRPLLGRPRASMGGKGGGQDRAAESSARRSRVCRRRSGARAVELARHLAERRRRSPGSFPRESPERRRGRLDHLVHPPRGKERRWVAAATHTERPAWETTPERLVALPRSDRW